MNQTQFEQAVRALNQAGESGWEYQASPQRRNYTVYAYGGAYRSYPLLMRVIQTRGQRSRAHAALLARVAQRMEGPPDPGIEDW